MPSIYQIKPAFQNLLRPLTRKLAALGVTANQITNTALLLSVLSGLALAYWSASTKIFFLVPVVMLLRMGLNAIDGMLAREHNMKTALGAFLNELSDVISDAALYLPFALVTQINPMLVVAVVIAAIISEMAGVVAVQVGASRRYDGPMGKSDRAFVFGAIALILALGIPFGVWLNILLSGVLLLLVLTTINRVRFALKEVTP
jgi:CDP-diacylglycerol--glycerol-3-phosphate 3-phosphatidyltransferase